MIPYGRQSIDDEDVAAVVKVLRSPRLTQGPAVEAFEDALAEKVDATHAVAFSSGTAALHAAVATLGIGPGDSVATSPLSFAASANCALYQGAVPVFVDIEASTLNLDPTLVPQSCRALVAVHYAGLPLNLARLGTMRSRIVEDAAHALGALGPDGPIGNCARSAMTMFSFHPVKAITTGEGGAVTTNSDDLADRLRQFRNHGIRPRRDLGGWAYEIAELGFNYRMTDMQAALGTAQLRKLDDFVERRNELAARYRDLLGGLPVELPPAAPPGQRHAYHLFPVRVADRRRIYEAMHEAGIAVQVHFVPLYHHPVYGREPSEAKSYPCTEAAYERLLSLPLFPELRDEEQQRVVDVLKRLL